jgi:hypothetical protein
MCCSFIVSYIWKMHGFDFIQFVCPVLLHALFYELKTILRNLLHLNPKQDKYCVNWTSSYVPRSQEEPVTTKALNKLITVWTQHQIKSECLESFNHLDKCQHKTTIEIRYKIYFYIYIYMYVYISWKWCTHNTFPWSKSIYIGDWLIQCYEMPVHLYLFTDGIWCANLTIWTSIIIVFTFLIYRYSYDR